jgi:ATP-dependent DNA ligase
LRYVSKVRNGFTPPLRRELRPLFRSLETGRCPFVNLPETRRSRWGLTLTKEEMEKCQWLKPRLVAQVEFTEWTPDGHLRHSSFLALRDDKDPRKVMREVTAPVVITNHLQLDEQDRRTHLRANQFLLSRKKKTT